MTYTFLELYDQFQAEHPKWRWQNCIDDIVGDIEKLVTVIEGYDFSGWDSREDAAEFYCNKWNIRFDKNGYIVRMNVGD